MCFVVVVFSLNAKTVMAEDQDISNLEACPTISTEIWIGIDISSQILYVKHGDEILLSTSIVTGMIYSHDTPVGLYEIYSKETSRYLDGYNDNGTTYHCWVDYWLPFYSGYGIHDASWRLEFGEDIYTYNGSHGCINIPPEVMPSIYNYVEVGTPVYIY